MTVAEFFRDTPMESFTRGSLVHGETAAFICPDEEKSLMYRIAGALNVTSYDGSAVYEEGRDYTVRNGRLALTPGTRIPVMTPALYYSEGEQPLLLVRKPDGTESPCYFAESNAITGFQVRVTYTHTDMWEGFRQPCERGRFARFLRLLQEGRDATVLFYGDSITYGANASFLQRIPPYQPPYPMLFAEALARLSGHTLHFAPPEAENAYAGPAPDFPTGERGTLTYVNTAVGGWSSETGVQRLDTHIAPQAGRVGCDLFVLAFGMNDGGREPEEIARNCETIVRRVRGLRPETETLLVSTMQPNPEAINGWNGSHPRQEAALLELAERLNADGAACAVACVNAASAAVLQKKRFLDYTGNNINHPNDFFSRVYAQTLLQTVIGYDTPLTALRGEH